MGTEPSTSSFDPTGGDWAWSPQPEAQRLVDALLGAFLSKRPEAATLAERMRAETGTRFKDWVGVILTPDTPETRERLEATGFTPKQTEFANEDIEYAFEQRLGVFPDILLTRSRRMSVGIRVESVADFFAAMQVPGIERVEGEPGCRSRWARAFGDDQAGLWVMERHGYDGFGLTDDPAEVRIAAMHYLERFRARPRCSGGESACLLELQKLIGVAVEEIGRDWACDLFFRAEREYWMRRNRAAQVQYARQQRLGLGWANHDHHTYRCSREHYAAIIESFEKLGFRCRERFYAGEDAGWGAQVLEQPATRLVIFADVDMSPEEVEGDFAHEGLPVRAPEAGVGTIGLWVALHGESLLAAGMHHLECQFDHAALVEQLERDAGVRTMAPFTSFPHLKQAFTEGERWPVEEDRLALCVQRGWIGVEMAEDFRRNGALGSHLENLERNDGYKGFNKMGVSEIIARTDARQQPSRNH